MLKIIEDIVIKSQILLLSMYAYTACEIDSLIMQLYNHHPAIAFVTDYILYCLLYIHSMMNQYYIEPFDNKWTYTAYLNHTNGYYVLNEKYNYCWIAVVDERIDAYHEVVFIEKNVRTF